MISLKTISTKCFFTIKRNNINHITFKLQHPMISLRIKPDDQDKKADAENLSECITEDCSNLSFQISTYALRSAASFPAGLYPIEQALQLPRHFSSNYCLN